MRLRSTKTPVPWSWNTFPAEVRTMILKTIAYQRNPGWGSLAAVCKEWQHVLETSNFNKLTLRVPCLDEFSRLIPQTSRLRPLVHHICLNIELPRYPSRCCSDKRAQPVDSGALVDYAIEKLFVILSGWQREDSLSLELNVYSLSDAEHWFKSIYLWSDHVDGTTTADPISDLIKYHDVQHGWEEGQQVQMAPHGSADQLFQPIILNNNHRPQVCAVDSFIMRRQLRRCFSPEGAMSLFRSLDGLETIWYEPWEPSNEFKNYHDMLLPFFISSGIDADVNNLVLFQDSRFFYRQFGQRPPPQVPMFFFDDESEDEDDSHCLGKVLVKKSLNMQSLALAYLITAEQVLDCCTSTLHWPHLVSLALTSPTLHPSSDGNIAALLCRATKTVPRMPQLRTLVLWYGEEGCASAFIFQRVG